MKRIQILLSLLLAALLLCGCGAVPSAQTAPAPAAEAVVVTDVSGLLNALAPGAVIEIDAAALELDRAPDYGFYYSSGAYTWESVGAGEYALVIRDLDDLTIRSRSEGGTSLTTGATNANVITLTNCRNVTLEGLTLGHRGEPGVCCGDVLFCDYCGDILVRGCDLFGCGVTAVNAWMCTRLTLEACTLRDCSSSAVNATLCTNVQIRDCTILRCVNGYGIGAVCAASCNGFALINSSIRDCSGSCLLDEMNCSSVFLLGCEATGNKFSEALFRIYDGGVTVSGCALTDNAFNKCYSIDKVYAVNESGQELTGFADFAHMELMPFKGEYIGPAPYVTPGDLWDMPYTTDGDIGYATPGDIYPSAPEPMPEWTGEREEKHVKTVDELLAAIAPHTTVYLDGEEFRISSAADYGSAPTEYYGWAEEFDGYTLVLKDLDDFALVGGGIGITLISTEPRYADVLRFENCRCIALSDMTMGHTPDSGTCTGDVLAIERCTGLTADRCGFFGCGEVGITASNSADLQVNESNIYDCSSYGAQLSAVESMSFTDCSISNCGGGGSWGFNGLLLSDCVGVSYNGVSLFNGRVDVESDG